MEVDMEMAQKAYAQLSEQEKELVREAVDSPLMGILAKVFGQEFIPVSYTHLTLPTILRV